MQDHFLVRHSWFTFKTLPKEAKLDKPLPRRGLCAHNPALRSPRNPSGSPAISPAGKIPSESAIPRYGSIGLLGEHSASLRAIAQPEWGPWAERTKGFLPPAGRKNNFSARFSQESLRSAHRAVNLFSAPFTRTNFRPANQVVFAQITFQPSSDFSATNWLFQTDKPFKQNHWHLCS